MLERWYVIGLVNGAFGAMLFLVTDIPAVVEYKYGTRLHSHIPYTA